MEIFFVKNDVQQWIDWGMDYLKYDWNPNDVYHVKEMMEALRSHKRDVVLVFQTVPLGEMQLNGKNGQLLAYHR